MLRDIKNMFPNPIVTKEHTFFEIFTLLDSEPMNDTNCHPNTQDIHQMGRSTNTNPLDNHWYYTDLGSRISIIFLSTLLHGWETCF